MLCGGCEADLARALGDVPWLAGQLDITLARLGSKHDGGTGEPNDDPTPAVLRIGPLGFDAGASEAKWVLKNALVGWVRILVQTHPEDYPADTLADIAVWLLARVERLAMHHDAGSAVDEIRSAVWHGIRLIDRPADLVYAGPCPCGTDLYARPEAPQVTCRGCKAEYRVSDRREWMLATIDGTLFHAAAMAHVLTSLGWPCTQGQIRQWASRGRVVAHGVDGQGHPVYRVSEVRERLMVVREREQAKRERMSA